MTERDRIREQLDRSFTGPGWHGPSVHEALAGVTAEQAAARPIASAHTIWEMVLHVASWKRIVRLRLAGESPRVEDSDARDWPPVAGAGEAAWRAALAALEAAHRELIEAVARLADDRLDDLLEQQPVAGHSTIYVQLHGLALHDVYHAGQIMILQRA